MADDDTEDPWLTLAEIAEELRLTPATIRSWVSSGTLRAWRPGKRKYLVRRSELDRMLAGRDLAAPTADEPDRPARVMDVIEAPHHSPHWPPEAVEHVTKAGWLGFVETEWCRGLQSSAMAPPDPYFLLRLRRIAEGAARKAAAMTNLDGDPPPEWWQRRPRLGRDPLSYELRPGGNRPGPADSWTGSISGRDALASAGRGVRQERSRRSQSCRSSSRTSSRTCRIATIRGSKTRGAETRSCGRSRRKIRPTTRRSALCRCGRKCFVSHFAQRNTRPARAPATTGIGTSSAHDYPPSTLITVREVG